MDKQIIKFSDTEIEKYKFHQHKNPILINNIDISKIVVCNKISFSKKSFKYFVGYKDGKKIRSSCIFLPKMSVYRRNFDDTKYIYIFKKIWEIVRKI